MALSSHELTKARSMQLSKNFTLFELIKSASRPGMVYYPSEDIISLLKSHAENILQPIRDEFGRVNINSGYRNEFLNKAVGGVNNSIHKIYHQSKLLGVATDITTQDESDLVKVMYFIKKHVPAARRVIIYRDLKPLKINSAFLHVDSDIKVPEGHIILMEKKGPGRYILFNEKEFDKYE